MQLGKMKSWNSKSLQSALIIVSIVLTLIQPLPAMPATILRRFWHHLKVDIRSQQCCWKNK